MTASMDKPARDGARELVVVRDLDVPRALVWSAWTNPLHLSRWWGPHGFACVRCEFEGVVGGAMRIDLRDEDGAVHSIVATVEEIAEPERLVFTGAALDADGSPMLKARNTLTLTERNGGTRLTLRIRILECVGDEREHMEGMEQGWAMCLDRLEATATPVRMEKRDHELILSRTFNAPPERVWRLWTDPEHLAHWWGPRGFTTTTHAMDLRPGGVWRYTMHGPDGTDYENRVTYSVVDAPRRLVFTHDDGNDDSIEPVCHEHHATFEALAGGAQTRVTMHTTFPSKDALEFVAREYGAIEGGKQHLTRLAEYLELERRLAEDASAVRPFTISRVFDAPRELVYKVWTDEAHLKQWFGPKGVTLPTCALDLRPGGTFLYEMRFPEGRHWGLWIFREIVPNERLVFTVSFADEKGNVARAPWDETWPLYMLSTITFARHAGKGGGTVVEIVWTPLDASDVERASFDAGRSSMTAGWGGTLDKLTEHLASMGATSA